MILEEIAENTREKLKKQKSEKPPAILRREAEAMAGNTGFPFLRAMKKPGLSFICEVEKSLSLEGGHRGGFSVSVHCQGI